jgi:hypothetical protein
MDADDFAARMADGLLIRLEVDILGREVRREVVATRRVPATWRDGLRIDLAGRLGRWAKRHPRAGEFLGVNAAVRRLNGRVRMETIETEVPIPGGRDAAGGPLAPGPVALTTRRRRRRVGESRPRNGPIARRRRPQSSQEL